MTLRSQTRRALTTVLLCMVGLFCVSALAAESKTKKDKIRGPDVVLVESKKETIQEIRQNGKLIMIKVVPKKGKPYFLVPEDPTKHFGDLDRTSRLVPRWNIKEF